MPSNEVNSHSDRPQSRGRSQSRRTADDSSQATGDGRSSTRNTTRSSRQNNSTQPTRRGSLRSYISTAVASIRSLRSGQPSDDGNSSHTDGNESIGRGNRRSSQDTSLTSLLVPRSGGGSSSRSGSYLGRTRSVHGHGSSSTGISRSPQAVNALNIFFINYNGGGGSGSAGFLTRALHIDSPLEDLRRAQQHDPSNVALAMQIGSMMEEGAQLIQEHLASHGVHLDTRDCRMILRHQMGRSGGNDRQVRELFEALRDRRDGLTWY